MSSQRSYEARRLSFGAVAEQYDRHRPSYPAELVDDALTYAGVGPGDMALEVGAGTGRATLLFAARGLALTVVEPDADMAGVARRRLEEAGLEAEILITDFEAAFDRDRDRAGLPEHAFGMLFSATAWHWVNAETRNQLAARALASGGALTPFWTRPAWERCELRPALDRAYAALKDRFGSEPTGAMTPSGRPHEPRDPGEWLDAWFDDRGHAFTDVEARTYLSTVTYTTADYLSLLGTHSDHIMLSVEARDYLFSQIAAVIDAVGGSFDLDYQSLLCLARRA